MVKTDLSGQTCDIQDTFSNVLKTKFCAPKVLERFADPRVILERIPTLISTISLFVLGVYILRHPKLQIHPYQLIGYICVTDSFLFFLQGTLSIAVLEFCNPSIFYAFNPY